MVKLPRYVLFLAFFFCLPSIVIARPMVQASVQGIVITVHSEDCELKNVVSNLPKKATWVENGKTFEGCAGASPLGVLMFYFHGDKTVAAVPADLFVPVTGI